MASSGRLARGSQRLHITSSQPYPPLRHCAIVGDGCAGPPYPSILIDHASASARTAVRTAFTASSRAPSDLGPAERLPKMTSRDLVLMAGITGTLAAQAMPL